MQADEQQDLEAEQTELAHASEIKEVLMWASQRLTGADDNLLAQLKEIESAIGRIATFYPRSEELHRRLHSNLLEIKDLTSEISSDADRIEADPQRLDAVENRLGTIYTLLQKHKASSVEELLKIQSEYETKLAEMSGAEERIAQLTSEIEAQQQKPKPWLRGLPRSGNRRPPRSKARSNGHLRNWVCPPPNCTSK